MVKVSTARATRPDPVQESLVQRKDKLNERVKELINLLIETKRSWNGKPAPTIGVNEPHSIKEPLPDETTSAMNEVVNIVNEVESGLDEVAKQQENYSKTRKQPQPKKTKQPIQQALPQQTQQTTEQTTEETLDLSSIASGTVSRFLSHVRAPFQFGDSNKWARLKLLRSASNIKNHLESINDSILSKSEEDIPQALYAAKDLFYTFDNELVEPILSAIKQLPEKESVETTDFQETDETYQDFDPRSQGTYQYIDVEYGLKSMRSELEALRKRLPQEEFRPFLESHNNIVRRIQYVTSLLKHNFEEAENEYKQLINDVRVFTETINNVSQSFQKDANRFSRFLKRKNLEYLTPSASHQKRLRLKIDKDIKKSLYYLNKLMDALEKPNIHLSSLSSYLKNTAYAMIDVYSDLVKLGDIYNSYAKTTKYKSKKGPSNIPGGDLTGIKRIIDGLKNVILKINSLEAQYG